MFVIPIRNSSCQQFQFRMYGPSCGINIIELQHEISDNVVCVTSKASDQPGHTRSLIRAFACRLNILFSVKLLTEHHLEFLS